MNARALVRFKRLDPAAQLPAFATAGSACFDFCTLEGFRLEPGRHKVVRTGLAVQLPPQHVLLLFIRSGLALRLGVSLANSVGVVDSDYRGEIKLALSLPPRFLPVQFQPGERVAQGLVLPAPALLLAESLELDLTERGEGGFGSTGTGGRLAPARDAAA